jgi:hypothetical protein
VVSHGRIYIYIYTLIYPWIYPWITSGSRPPAAPLILTQVRCSRLQSDKCVFLKFAVRCPISNIYKRTWNMSRRVLLQPQGPGTQLYTCLTCDSHSVHNVATIVFAYGILTRSQGTNLGLARPQNCFMLPHTSCWKRRKEPYFCSFFAFSLWL